VPRNRTALLDDRDREILALLAEHRVAVSAQLEMAFDDLPAQALGARLRRLAKGGLITMQRIFEGRPTAISITARGLGAIESRLPAPRVDLKGYRHDIGVGWLHLAARQGVFGKLVEVRLERELRSHDRRADRESPPLGIGVGTFGRAGRPSRHYPDLLMTTAGGHQVAVELELTAKSSHRLVQIMRAYASDARVSALLYLVPDAAGARRIETAARRAGIGSLVHVQQLAEDGIHGAPPPIATGRAPIARSRAATAAVRAG
jgi:hypothetical protein